jgi:hypothetical protein
MLGCQSHSEGRLTTPHPVTVDALNNCQFFRASAVRDRGVCDHGRTSEHVLQGDLGGRCRFPYSTLPLKKPSCDATAQSSHAMTLVPALYN